MSWDDWPKDFTGLDPIDAYILGRLQGIHMMRPDHRKQSFKIAIKDRLIYVYPPEFTMRETWGIELHRNYRQGDRAKFVVEGNSLEEAWVAAQLASTDDD